MNNETGRDAGETDEPVMLDEDAEEVLRAGGDEELALLRYLERLTTGGDARARPLPPALRPYFVYTWDLPGRWQSWRVGRQNPDGHWAQREGDRAFPYTVEGEKAALRYAVQHNLDLARRARHRWGCADLDE